MPYLLIIWITLINPSGIDIRVEKIEHRTAESCEAARRMISMAYVTAGSADARVEAYCVAR